MFGIRVCKDTGSVVEYVFEEIVLKVNASQRLAVDASNGDS